MHRRDDETDDGTGLAGLSPVVSGPPGQTVIPFRRAATSASFGSAAGGDPPSPPPAPFEPLGDAVAAVVLRLRGGFPRVKVLAPVLGEEEEDRDQR